MPSAIKTRLRPTEFGGLDDCPAEVVFVFPALWLIPGPDHGHQEDLVDTLVMFYNSTAAEDQTVSG